VLTGTPPPLQLTVKHSLGAEESESWAIIGAAVTSYSTAAASWRTPYTTYIVPTRNQWLGTETGCVVDNSTVIYTPPYSAMPHLGPARIQSCFLWRLAILSSLSRLISTIARSDVGSRRNQAHSRRPTPTGVRNRTSNCTHPLGHLITCCSPPAENLVDLFWGAASSLITSAGLLDLHCVHVSPLGRHLCSGSSGPAKHPIRTYQCRPPASTRQSRIHGLWWSHAIGPVVDKIRLWLRRPSSLPPPPDRQSD
jgi:hypothetical protein